MLCTTLTAIRSKSPCDDVWKKLLKGVGGLKKYGAKTPLSYTRILEINGLSRCLWAIANTMNEPHKTTILRLFTVACAQDVLRLMDDSRSRDAVKVAHLYAHGEADVAARVATRDAAWDAVRVATWDTARASAKAAAEAATWDAARGSAWGTAWDAARAASWAAAWDAAGDATWDAARNSAWDTARDAAVARYSEWLKIILERFEEAWEI